MNYGRDYGNRNFVERAANTVRGWLGGDHYDRGYQGGGRTQGGMYGGDRQRGGYGREGYREMGAMGAGYGRGRSDFDSYQAGGYRPDHGGWDVDWNRNAGGGYGGQQRHSGGMFGAGGREFAGRGDYSRDYGNQGRYDAGYRSRGFAGGYAGGQHEPYRGRVQRADYGRDYQAGNQGNQGHYGLNDSGAGDVGGGTIGNYGPYSSYGIDRFRNASSGGVQPGAYYTGYGVGTGYR